MKTVVIGGAGKMGSVAVQDLAHDDRVDDVVIADFDLEQARNVARIIDSSKISVEPSMLATTTRSSRSSRGPTPASTPPSTTST